jgi:hypothetical protein
VTSENAAFCNTQSEVEQTLLAHPNYNGRQERGR